MEKVSAVRSLLKKGVLGVVELYFRGGFRVTTSSRSSIIIDDCLSFEQIFFSSFKAEDD